MISQMSRERSKALFRSVKIMKNKERQTLSQIERDKGDMKTECDMVSQFASGTKKYRKNDEIIFNCKISC